MKYIVRRADFSDLDKLVEFTISEAIEAEGRMLSADKLSVGISAGLEDDTLARYWVIEDSNKQVVGNASVYREWSDWSGDYYWWIQSMFIAPNYRGKGLIDLLVEKVIEAAKMENALELRLYVHDQNSRAINAYKRLGFKDTAYTIMAAEI